MNVFFRHSRCVTNYANPVIACEKITHITGKVLRNLLRDAVAGNGVQRFHQQVPAKAAQEVLAKIKGDYEQAYYAGLIWERVGHARIREGGTAGGASAYHALREAMIDYERAIDVASPGNDDAILRWNTCARVIMQNPEVRPLPDEDLAQGWVRDEAGSRIADA